MSREALMILLLLVVIAAAFTLPIWAAVIQSAIAGVSIGAKLVILKNRSDEARRALEAKHE